MTYLNVSYTAPKKAKREPDVLTALIEKRDKVINDAVRVQSTGSGFNLMTSTRDINFYFLSASSALAASERIAVAAKEHKFAVTCLLSFDDKDGG